MNNELIVIENGRLHTYCLDNRAQWMVGRPSKDASPDIKLYSTTISREHGLFKNVSGVWFYSDCYGKNGTVYNGQHVEKGLYGREKSIMLSDGDVLIFGGGTEPVINEKTVWALYLECCYEKDWRVVDTKGVTSVTFSDGMDELTFQKPSKGLVVRLKQGIAIYMEDVTYMTRAVSIIKSEVTKD